MDKTCNSFSMRTPQNNLVAIWTKRARRSLMRDRPLHGIYCVYSMYWRPDPRKYQP